MLQKKNTLKKRAVETRELPAQIIGQVRGTTSRATAGRLERDKVLARIVQRARERVGAQRSVFRTRREITIPEDLRLYESAPGVTENFILADSGTTDEDRVLIFGREEPESWIHTVRNVYVCGASSRMRREKLRFQ